MIEVTLDRPWLAARLPQGFRALSHAPHNPGFHPTDTVLWREVRNADLPQDFAAEDWFAAQIAARAPGAVGMMTSRDVGLWGKAWAVVQGITAECVVTLGLSNAEAVGTRLPWHPADGSLRGSARPMGTINLLVATDAALTEAAQIEALTIAVQARTAAVIATGLDLPTGRATGTGTDCVVVACPPGTLPYAGLHTAVGEALGRAVRDAVGLAARDWMANRPG